jgi:hypothetical protein
MMQEQNKISVFIICVTEKTLGFLFDKLHSLSIQTLRNVFSYILIMGDFISHTKLCNVKIHCSQNDLLPHRHVVKSLISDRKLCYGIVSVSM